MERERQTVSFERLLRPDLPLLLTIMASAADVRSILSIPTTSAGLSQTKKPSLGSTRKPEGISRELYSLIGPSAPTLATQLAKPRLKQKPNLGGGGKVKWCELTCTIALNLLEKLCREWRQFKNDARSDSLKLGHWVKATDDGNAGTSFEFNPSYGVPSMQYRVQICEI